MSDESTPRPDDELETSKDETEIKAPASQEEDAKAPQPPSEEDGDAGGPDPTPPAQDDHQEHHPPGRPSPVLESGAEADPETEEGGSEDLSSVKEKEEDSSSPAAPAPAPPHVVDAKPSAPEPRTPEEPLPVASVRAHMSPVVDADFEMEEIAERSEAVEESGPEPVDMRERAVTEGLPIEEKQTAALLESLAKVAQECGLHTLEQELRKERIPALERGRITLVVLGEFNHGKSTVINSLLGEDVLPMGITPTTSVITHVVHSQQPYAKIFPGLGQDPVDLPYDQLGDTVRHTVEEEAKEPEYVEVGYPNPMLDQSLILVDTPGVNDISRQKVEITYGYLPRADVVLYVLDATQVLKKSEVAFIRDRLLKANRERIIFILNKVDALDPEDLKEVEDYARERLTSLIGPFEMFSFSGREAFKAQREGGPKPQEFVRFHEYLTRFLQEQRAYIMIDSALAGGLRVSSLLEQNLAIKRHGYQLEAGELAKRIAAVRQKLSDSRRLIAENMQLIDDRIAGIAATAKHNLRIFSDQFLEQLPLQIERAEARDVKRHLPSWIQDTFKQWIEREGQAVARNLEELAEEIIEITNESLKDAVETYQEAFGLSGELNLEVDTVAYDLSVFALGAFGVSVFFFANMLVGTLLTLATPVFAFLLKDKIDTKIKERAREEGVKAIQNASAKLQEELLLVIHDYGDRLKQFVDTAGDRLYRQIEEALTQVQEETQGDDVDRAALLQRANDSLGQVHKIAHTLKDSRAQLARWAEEAFQDDGSHAS